MDDGIYRLKKSLEEARFTARTMTEKRQALMAEYAAARQETWDAGQEICPTCGQNLPPERVQELRAAFNQKKSEKLASINARGKSECSQDMIKAAETKAQDVEAELFAAESVRESTAQRLKNLKEAVVTLPPFETTEEYLEITPEWYTKGRSRTSTSSPEKSSGERRKATRSSAMWPTSR